LKVKRNKNIFKSLFGFICRVMAKVGLFFKALDNFILNLIAKFKIGIRIMAFTLLLILAIVVLISWQSTTNFYNFTLENEKEILNSELNRIYRDIHAQVSSVADFLDKATARDELKNIVKEYSTLNVDEIEEDLELESYNDAEILLAHRVHGGNFGIEIRDNKFNKIHTFGESVNTIYESNPEILEIYKRVAETLISMRFSFMTLSDYKGEAGQYGSFIEIGAVQKISSTGFFGPSGVALARERYQYDRFFEIILPNNYMDIVQLYKGDQIHQTNVGLGSVGSIVSKLENNYKNNSISRINLIDEEIKGLFENNNRLNTYVRLMNLDYQDRELGEDDEYIYENYTEPFLVGYIALRNFHNKPIAYVTYIKPLDHMTTFISDVQSRYIYNAVIFILISLLIVLFITRSITKPLNQLNIATQKIAAGDLKTLVNIKTKDQIANVAENFNKMTMNLKNIVGEIMGASENVFSMSQKLSTSTEEATAVSEEVAATSEEIASGTENQVAQTNKTKEILEVVETHAGKVVESSLKVNNAVDNASNKSNHGIIAIKDLSTTMTEIMKEVNKTGNQVKGLKEQIGKITTVIDAIDYINEETSLLSLNAAIEAARAGDAGRGFAVVADEIRKLAAESDRSVQEIHNIFKEINIAMELVEQSMESSGNMVQNSEEAVANVEVSFEDILSSVEQVKLISEEINHYVEEQKNSLKEIAEAIDDVHRIAELNAEGADQSAKLNEDKVLIIEQIAKSAGELSNMANHLKSLIDVFNV